MVHDIKPVGALPILNTPPSLLVFPNPERMAACMVNRWERLGAAAIARRGRFAVALSGGKTPLVFYGALAAKGAPCWAKTHIFLVDERFVPASSDESNLGTISRNLLKAVPLPPENIHPIRTDGKNSRVSARWYEEELIRFFELDAGEIPQFDLIMLGIGSDGHTASIFPGSPGLREKDKLAVDSWSPQPPHERVSLTLPVINHGRRVVILVTGEEKAQIAKAVYEKSDLTLPASRIRPEPGKFLFLTDAKAASAICPCTRRSGGNRHPSCHRP